MSEEHDSWFSSIGVDIEKLKSAGKALVETVEDKGKAWVAQKVDDVKSDVQSAEEWAKKEYDAGKKFVAEKEDEGKKWLAEKKDEVDKAVGSVKKTVAGDQSGKQVPRPMEADCKPEHGKVPGPKNHIYCGTHGHVLDTDAQQIIAASIAAYVKAGLAKGAGQPAPAQPSGGNSKPPVDPGPAGKTDMKVPRPMPPGIKLVHGKVPGPKNHLLSDPEGFVVDTDTKQIIANSLAEYTKSHGDQPTPTTGPLAPGDTVVVGNLRYVIFEKEVRSGGTVSWRACNPGNIRQGAKYGAYAGKKLPTQSVGSFAIFPDEATGFAAISLLLKDYGKITIAAAMNKYAPAGDGANDPGKYARAVAKACGATVDTTLDTLSASQLSTFAEAIKRVEGWKPGTTYARNDPKLPEAVRSRLTP